MRDDTCMMLLTYEDMMSRGCRVGSLVVLTSYSDGVMVASRTRLL
jgi:hypothetical protein